MQYKCKSNNMVNVSYIWNLKTKQNKLIDKEKIGGCQRKEVVVGQVDERGKKVKKQKQKNLKEKSNFVAFSAELSLPYPGLTLTFRVFWFFKVKLC